MPLLKNFLKLALVIGFEQRAVAFGIPRADELRRRFVRRAMGGFEHGHAVAQVGAGGNADATHLGVESPHWIPAFAGMTKPGAALSWKSGSYF